MAGIALGVAALIVVLSVVNGFQQGDCARASCGGIARRDTRRAAARRLAAASPRSRRSESQRQGRRAVRDGPGDAQRGRRLPRTCRPRHRSRARGCRHRHRTPHARRFARAICGQASSASCSAPSSRATLQASTSGDSVALISPQGSWSRTGMLPPVRAFRRDRHLRASACTNSTTASRSSTSTDAQRLFGLDGVTGVRAESRRSVRRAVRGARPLAAGCRVQARDPRLDAVALELLPRGARRRSASCSSCSC